MKIFLTFSLVIVAFIIGGIAGYYIDRHQCARAVSNIVVSDEFEQASGAFTTLVDLRNGNTNAVFDNLEGELDIGAVSLSSVLAEDPWIEHATNYQIFLRRVADYRAKFPHHSEISNVDSMVAKALGKANKEPSR